MCVAFCVEICEEHVTSYTVEALNCHLVVGSLTRYMIACHVNIFIADHFHTWLDSLLNDPCTWIHVEVFRVVTSHNVVLGYKCFG